MSGMERWIVVATVVEFVVAVAAAAAVVVVAAAVVGHIVVVVVGDFVFEAEGEMVDAVNKPIVVAAVDKETAVAGSDMMIAVDVLAETVALVAVGIAVTVIAERTLGVGENKLVGMVVVVDCATAAAQLVDSWAATAEEAAVVVEKEEERTVMSECHGSYMAVDRTDEHLQEGHTARPAHY